MTVQNSSQRPPGVSHLIFFAVVIPIDRRVAGHSVSWRPSLPSRAGQGRNDPSSRFLLSVFLSSGHPKEKAWTVQGAPAGRVDDYDEENIIKWCGEITDGQGGDGGWPQLWNRLGLS